MNIKDYLHLYLGQQCRCYNHADRDGWIETISCTIIIEHGDEDSEIEGIVPILRPLSDMMEEEARQFCISEGWGENLENIAVTDGGIDFTIARTSGYCRFSRLRPSSFITLLSKGFDLFGLIEAGLAIDKTNI